MIIKLYEINKLCHLVFIWKISMCSKERSILRAPAKVNLALHVCHRHEETGYHDLDSLVVFADIADTISVSPSHQWSLEITGEFADALASQDNHSENNLILRAAKMASPQKSYSFVLEKNLPVASGIGGGSADAAAVLRFLDHRLTTNDIVTLGADIPVCLFGNTARIQGVGDRVTPISSLPKCAIVLVNPGQAISTRTIFEALPRQNRTPLDMSALINPMTLKDFVAWLCETTRNDLQDSAMSFLPDIHKVLDCLNQDSLFARMSGSGATCFGLYASLGEARIAEKNIKRKHPEWWVRSGSVL
jgi:4-diphosphocytidyl-2-C-methyl-D-erythritol kinase